MEVNGGGSSTAEVGAWVSDQKYARFLKHYQDMQKWMEEYVTSWKHSSAQTQPTCSGPTFGNQYHMSPIAVHGSHHPYWSNTMYAHHSNHAPQTMQSTSQKNSAHKRQQQQARLHSKSHYRNTEDRKRATKWSEEEQLREEADNFELEVSEEMKEFFAKSEEFRQQRDKAKLSGQTVKAQAVESDQEPKTEDEVMTSESEIREDLQQLETSAPVERPGVRRIVEMKELYGRHAATIHGMETAIQLQFDRTCDRKQPAYWPIVPLKM